MKKACFLDRDGVLVEEADYLADPNKAVLIDGAAEAVKKLRENSFTVIVVSNQSGIARGYFSEETLSLINKRIAELLAESGAAVDAWYHCPHHPDGKIECYKTECSCRKPAPGMILRAAEEYNISLSKSAMIGDKKSDIEAGFNAGCRIGILVSTGYGAEGIPDSMPRDTVFKKNISDAADYVIEILKNE
ncbi:MAG: hypothetical protein A2020_15200 [Lentisphaerae bacterium GWF2_45_14]|nr:MAG: hypothetical protein A2020_15200 [Lentisphaerae bacterium GWF2_45_14]